MAIWQHRLLMVPAEAVSRRYGHLPTMVPSTDTEVMWWSDHQPARDLETAIEKSLPSLKSWSPRVRYWGKEDGDVAIVVYAEDGPTIEEIAFQIDVRSLNLAWIAAICSIAEASSSLLLSNDFRIVAPSVSAVLAIVNSSRAKQFVDDPIAALTALKKKDVTRS